MRQFLQQLVNGTVLGATYGLIALGYTMVYGIIQLINFAHGEIFMVGAFAALASQRWVVPDSFAANPWAALAVMLVAAVVVSVTAAVLMERLAYRPLRDAPRLAPLITAIGVSIFLQELVRIFYPGGNRPQPFPAVITGAVVVGGVRLAWVSVFVVATAVVLMLALQGFIRTTKTGKAMRATAQDPDTARLMGIDTDRVIVVTFALGAALAAVAGVMYGMRFGQIDYRIGFVTGLKAFTAAVLGGIGNVSGAMLGGFVLGMVEVMAVQYIPHGSAWRDAWAFAVLILVLVFRPAGLLGERVRS
ncbi:MAG: branched-chain amino acid transport system permease protein [Actinomycetota bacterium]|jgi:branched-chain amino acid transport system permease protein|nr:branched-chain amino acid transport system permease protein [Actinomycetota bacterium]MEA2933214.1 branched-chain amino acid transport system permease protein [Actinomycetota bacterium]